MAAARRLNLSLPPVLLKELRTWAVRRRARTPQLVRQLLTDGLARLRQDEMEALLREGYRVLAGQDRELLDEFRHADGEGW